jgi:F-type H+-transporting ATPase subunit a
VNAVIEWLKDAFDGPDPEFLIHGQMLLPYKVFGQNVFLTTTHCCLLVIIIVMTCLCVFLGRSVKNAKEIPEGIQNLAEFAVDTLDNYVRGSMGKFAPEFRNYIGTVFVFIWLSNTSGMFGQRNPTGDYGTTLALALITFTLIQVAEIKYQKVSGFCKNLISPTPIFLPINIIGKLSTPISLSLRLFANNLSGIVMLTLLYGLLGYVALIWPAFLHVYFDLFVGSIQAYVFTILSMNYINASCTGD